MCFFETVVPTHQATYSYNSRFHNIYSKTRKNYIYFGNISRHKAKVKVILVQALRLCTGPTAHRGSRGIAVLFHNQRHQKWVRVQRHAAAGLYPRGKTQYPLYRGLGGPQGRSGQVRKVSPPPRFDPRHRPARNQSLYRLSYPAHMLSVVYTNFGEHGA